MSDQAPFVFTPNPNFDLQRQQALGAYNDALGQLRQQQRDLLSQSGYNYTTDANGNVQMGGLDVHNQYGTMQRMYQDQGDALVHSYNAAHSRNLGAYGLGHQGISQLQRAQAGQRVDAGNQMMGSLNNYRTSIANATTSYNNTLNNLADQQAQFNAQQQQANTQAQAAAAAAAAAQQAAAPAPAPAGPPPMAASPGPTVFVPATPGIAPSGQIARSRNIPDL